MLYHKKAFPRSILDYYWNTILVRTNQILNAMILHISHIVLLVVSSKYSKYAVTLSRLWNISWYIKANLLRTDDCWWLLLKATQHCAWIFYFRFITRTSNEAIVSFTSSASLSSSITFNGRGTLSRHHNINRFSFFVFLTIRCLNCRSPLLNKGKICNIVFLILELCLACIRNNGSAWLNHF